MEGVTFDGMKTFVLVLLALCGALSVIWGAIKAVREMRKPKADQLSEIVARLDKHKHMFANDDRRLEEHEQAMHDLRKGLMATCYGVQVLIEHELHNGNGDTMRKASDEIGEWLRER